MAKQIMLLTQPTLSELEAAVNAALSRLAKQGYRVFDPQLVDVAGGLVLMFVYDDEPTSAGDTSPR